MTGIYMLLVQLARFGVLFKQRKAKTKTLMLDTCQGVALSTAYLMGKEAGWMLAEFKNLPRMTNILSIPLRCNLFGLRPCVGLF